MYSILVEKLISALRCLPGVGSRSAQRMAFHLLQRGRNHGLALALALEQAIHKIQHCSLCRNLCETDICHICANPQRDASLLCIVETPSDVIAIEQTANYKGLYFILMGHLSPLDGVGPNEIGIPELLQLVTQKATNEVILATNPTVEGEATAHYIVELLKNNNSNLRCTRIAHGIPMGSELEYIDSNTLGRALADRHEII
jgi:recombination protein RecR